MKVIEPKTAVRPEMLLFLGLSLGIILPILINLVSTMVFSGIMFENILFHFILEMLGVLIILSLAGILTFKIIFQKQDLPLTYLWLICAFTSMGILSFLHALVEPGNTFVWLHSLSIFCGGLFLGLCWIPISKKLKGHLHFLKLAVFVVLLVILGIGVFSLIFPNFVPIMVSKGNFSFTAKLLNFLGGFLSLAAAFYFMVEYLKVNNKNNLILAILCSLLGATGILFQFSELWDVSWWAWHILRVISYIFGMFILLKSPSHNLFKKKIKKKSRF